VKVKSLSCVWLCDHVDYSLQGFSLHGILQARILEWVTISFSRGSSRPRDQTQVSRIGGRHFNLWATGEPCLVANPCPPLFDPMDCSPSGSTVHGIVQARILEWIAISFSRESFQPRDQLVPPALAGRFFFFFFTTEPRGKPRVKFRSHQYVCSIRNYEADKNFSGSLRRQPRRIRKTSTFFW